MMSCLNFLSTISFTQRNDGKLCLLSCCLQTFKKISVHCNQHHRTQWFGTIYKFCSKDNSAVRNEKNHTNLHISVRTFCNQQLLVIFPPKPIKKASQHKVLRMEKLIIEECWWNENHVSEYDKPRLLWKNRNT